MSFKILLWIPDKSLQTAIKSTLTEADYYVVIVNDESSLRSETNLRNCSLLLLDLELLQDRADAIYFIDRLRNLNKCRVLALSKPELYPLLREEKLPNSQMIDHILFYPIDEYELKENVRRYLEK